MTDLVYLGIDTSCYTTSVALVDAHGRVLQDERLLLPVGSGEHGLRQSDAVFQHVRQLPELLRRIVWSPRHLQAVGVSLRPRPVDGSYMPVFLTGLVAAQAVATAAGVPLYEFSHQEGHLAAGWAELSGGPCLAVQISGGTSEVLLVDPQPAGGFAIDLLAGTSDLSAGQMIDRVGVALGLPFPAGPALERLARHASGRLALPSSVNDLSFSFSGPCTAALRLVEQQQDAAEIAFAVLRVVANSLEKVLRLAHERYRRSQVLLVGGVMSNLLIRERLEHRLGPTMQLVFAEPTLSSDNAVGVARLACRRQQSGLLA